VLPTQFLDKPVTTKMVGHVLHNFQGNQEEHRKWSEYIDAILEKMGFHSTTYLLCPYDRTFWRNGVDFC